MSKGGKNKVTVKKKGERKNNFKTENQKPQELNQSKIEKINNTDTDYFLFTEITVKSFNLFTE